MYEKNRDRIPDTVDELLGRVKKRQSIFGGFQRHEELVAWRNEQIQVDRERLDKT